MFPLRAAAVLVCCAEPLFAGVTLDGSFGTKGALPGPSYMISASFGKQVGANLFQSFSQFNLASSPVVESATFDVPTGVQNVLARVTGGNSSSIDGTINCQGANLFFLNSAGVMFGPQAKLNVSGSVAISTANYLRLADGGRFNVYLGDDSMLTAAPVSAFGFLNSTPASVSISGSTLNVASQQNFSIVAGDISVDGGAIAGQGSRVNLISVKSPGEAQVDATDLNTTVDATQFTALGEIDLTNGTLIETNGPGGGPVIVRARTLLLDNSTISSNTTGDLAGGPIDIKTTENVKIMDLSQISTGAGSAALPPFAFGPFGNGSAGNLSITTGSLFVDGFIETITGGTGSTGTVNVTAKSITIETTTLFSAGIMNLRGTDLSTGLPATGMVGDLNVTAKSLSLEGRPKFGPASEILTAGGKINIVADKLQLNLSTIGSTGQINSNSGDINVTAKFLSLDGSDISSTAALPGENSGTIDIVTDSLQLANSFIDTGSTSSGKAGDITIHAGDVKMKGGFITSESTGAAGSIKVVSDGDIKLRDGSSITVSAVENGGDIKLKAPILLSLIDSSITATAGNTGGNVTIDSIALQLKSGKISASAGVQGGHIDLFTSFLVGPVEAVEPNGTLLLAFKSSISATGGTANGTVNINAPQLDLGAELITLPESLVDAATQLQERCTALLQGDFSSFISIGRGGTELEPDEPQDEF